MSVSPIGSPASTNETQATFKTAYYRTNQYEVVVRRLYVGILSSRVVRGLGRSLNVPYEACVNKSWKMATAEPVSQCFTLRIFFHFFRVLFSIHKLLYQN